MVNEWFPSQAVNFHWSHFRACRRFQNNRCQILTTLNNEGSRSFVVEVHSTNRKPMVGFLADVLCVQHRFRDFEVKIQWPRYMTVQGQPTSKVMVAIDTSWVVSCWTPINRLQNFAIKFLWPWTKIVQRDPGSKFIVAIESPCLTSHLMSFESNTIALTV